MENKENKELFSLRPVLKTTPKGFIDLSTVKESGASKIYKTKSAAKAQATRKKNKAKKEKPSPKLTREEIWWKNRMYEELLSHINDMQAILRAKMNKEKQKNSPLLMVSDEELNRRIESLIKTLNSK